MEYGLIGEHLPHSFSPEIHKRIGDYKYEIKELRPEELGEFLSHMHVFTWKHTMGGIEKLNLSEGEDMWKSVLAQHADGYALIEFVKDDSDEMLLSDAVALRKWLNG